LIRKVTYTNTSQGREDLQWDVVDGLTDLLPVRLKQYLLQGTGFFDGGLLCRFGLKRSVRPS
jgi:hypothetical protein